jgi:hypothetical protein
VVDESWVALYARLKSDNDLSRDASFVDRLALSQIGALERSATRNALFRRTGVQLDGIFAPPIAGKSPCGDVDDGQMPRRLVNIAAGPDSG